MMFRVLVSILLIIIRRIGKAEIVLDVDNTLIDFADLLSPCTRLRPVVDRQDYQHKGKGNVIIDDDHLRSQAQGSDGTGKKKVSKRNVPVVPPISLSQAHKQQQQQQHRSLQQQGNSLRNSISSGTHSHHHHSHSSSSLSSLRDLPIMGDHNLHSMSELPPQPGQMAPVTIGDTTVTSAPANGLQFGVGGGFGIFNPPLDISLSDNQQPSHVETPSGPPTVPPTYEPWVIDRIPHIQHITGLRHEMSIQPLVDQLRLYPTFKSYMQNNTDHHVSTTSQQQSMDDLLSTTPSSVWKPSPHPPPYAFFDMNTHHTRLTWCELDKYSQDNDFLWQSMRNRRLVLIGDSVTRYQYLDFVYFLTYKQWNHESRLVNEHQYSNWTEFFESTNHLFNIPSDSRQGYGKVKNEKRKVSELCECYRNTCCRDTWHVNENRKYTNEELNTTVWFFTWFGDLSLPHGHFDIVNDIQPLDCMPSNCDELATNHSWIAKSTAEFLYTFALHQQPDYVILNTGLHTAMDGRNVLFAREAKEWRKYAMLLKQKQQQRQHQDHSKEKSSTSSRLTKFVYKSVTSLVQERHVADQRDSNFGALQLASHGIWEYWDIAAPIYELYIAYRKLETAYNFYHSDKSNGLGSNRGFSWDSIHFTPWVYREINKMMILKFFTDLNSPDRRV